MIKLFGVPQTLAKLAEVAVVGEAGAELAAEGVKLEVAETARSLVASAGSRWLPPSWSEPIEGFTTCPLPRGKSCNLIL